MHAWWDKMLNSVKALLCIVFLLTLITVPLMFETDARKTARSIELIRKHAQTAAAHKNAIATNKKNFPMPGTGRLFMSLVPMSLLEHHPALMAK